MYQMILKNRLQSLLKYKPLWILGLPVVLVLFFIVLIFPPMGEGSRLSAKKWMRNFSNISTPRQAQKTYPSVVVKTFENGEWVFGICKDSHSSMFGGTVVVKDSRGTVRAFFGHVCGGNFLRGAILSRENNIDDVYRRLNACHFQEYKTSH
ncbi:TPA: hypothetical protein DDW35_06200 [Candidatus Sumerlaeota bacterium]|jgi:hypothetical protein|nr:hypothetical protein [Candidatus Sumerlaeota bacterium]